MCFHILTPLFTTVLDASKHLVSRKQSDGWEAGGSLEDTQLIRVASGLLFCEATQVLRSLRTHGRSRDGQGHSTMPREQQF